MVLAEIPQKAMRWSISQFYSLSVDAGFAVEDIIVTGRKHTAPDILRALINVEKGDPILSFNPRHAKILLEKISWVESAHVERHLPHEIYIGLKEREPAFLWQNDHKIRVIDEHGVTLTDENLENFKDLFLIAGDYAPENAPILMRLLDAEPDLRPHIQAATWIGDRRWDLTLNNGVIVKLPEADAGQALYRLAKVQRENNIVSQDILTIDLRRPDRLVIRSKPGETQTITSDSKGT